MNTNLIISSVLYCLFIIISILILLKKKKISIKYSLIWIILFSILLISTIIPGFLIYITNILGFKVGSNMIFSLILSVLVIITISLTVIVSQQDKKVRLLVQEFSILKNKIGDKNE